MSYATLILGESGTGKTASLRNLDPAKTFLIQPMRKPLPFRPKGWKEVPADWKAVAAGAGNILVTSNPQAIIRAMDIAPQEIIIVDDWQYILSDAYMSRRNEKGFEKFTAIGGAGYDIAKKASNLAGNKRCYVLAHSHTDDFGNTRIKTLGKLLDDKVVVEGLFTTVLRTVVDSGHFYFSTQNNGTDTVKSPMGMFEAALIENDLAAVDAAICAYYGINQEQSNEV